jgi:phosphohistidine phosphatase
LPKETEMKKLIIVRHSRAEDQTSDFTDFERSLTGKGKLVARQMAKRLKEKEKKPGVFITSPAFRALETALIFAEEFNIESDKVILNSKMYFRMSSQVLDEIFSQTHDDKDTITIFGHNPSFSDIANVMSREGCDYMPKCGIAVISFNVKKWSEVIRTKGKMEFFLKPEKAL